MYRYGIKNVYRPSQLVNTAYGWTGAPGYARADVPTAMINTQDVTAEELLQQFAYEWYQSGGVATGYSNPPFVSGAAGRLMPSLQTGTGQPPRILRGYIRRAQSEVGDEKSKARLYFMYNPETITRDYVSYLEQGALDPFNTVYQSGNLVAPPSILDFSFDLFFDRQEEAQQPDHPGVYVDYQFFDMVVRNVVPSGVPDNNTIPDNGVMMVNPRDITVVFSPQLTVQGRPLNARISFEKFTHRMTPIRMRISLVIRAVYIGPVRDMTEYTAETFAAEGAIPFGRALDNGVIITQLQADEAAADANNDNNDTDNDGNANPSVPVTGTTLPAGFVSGYRQNYHQQVTLTGDNNNKVRTAALNWAFANVVPYQTRYVKGANRMDLPRSADCSGLVTRAYQRIGQLSPAFNGQHLSTAMMWSWFRGGGSRYWQNLGNAQSNQSARYGDIMLKDGHVMFFVGWEGGKWVCFDAASSSSSPQVGMRTNTPNGKYTIWRAVPLGANMSFNSGSV